MCTVSWLHYQSGYELFCNRDERFTRKPAVAPYVQIRRDVQFIAPADGDHGGAWIGVNEFRISFCLINRYSCPSKRLAKAHESRGLLLHGLLDCRSQREACRRFQKFHLDSFRPFSLVILEPGKPAMLMHWSGRNSAVEWDGEHAMPLVSSSFDQEGVDAHRRRLFQRWVAERGGVTADLLADFHRSHHAQPCASSVCMHRDDAATVSFSRIRVSSALIEFLYVDQAPCAGSWPKLDELAVEFPENRGKQTASGTFRCSMVPAVHHEVRSPTSDESPARRGQAFSLGSL